MTITFINDLGVLPFPLESEVLYSDEEGTEFIGEMGEMAFIHVNYEGMTPSKYKRLSLIWEDIEEELRDRGYDMVFCVTPTKFPIVNRIEKMFGAELVDEAPGAKLFMKSLGDL